MPVGSRNEEEGKALEGCHEFLVISYNLVYHFFRFLVQIAFGNDCGGAAHVDNAVVSDVCGHHRRSPHGLALQEKQGTRLPIYSDSVNAQKWIRIGICKTQLEENEQNAPIFDLIRRAESWLRTHTFRLPIYKWETSKWGEIPADFGRKKH